MVTNQLPVFQNIHFPGDLGEILPSGLYSKGGKLISLLIKLLGMIIIGWYEIPLS